MGRLKLYDAMNHFWAAYSTHEGLGEREYFVFGYICNLSNRLGGKNPLTVDMGRAAQTLGIHDMQWARARDRLVEAGLLRWSKGARGRRQAVYEIVYASAAAPESEGRGGASLGVGQNCGRSVSESVRESVSLQGTETEKEKERERDAGSPPPELIEELQRRYPRRKDVRRVVGKMRARYGGDPRQMTLERACEWMETERNPKRAKADEVPPEPDGFREAMREKWPDTPLIEASWEFLWRNDRRTIDEVWGLRRLVGGGGGAQV